VQTRKKEDAEKKYKEEKGVPILQGEVAEGQRSTGEEKKAEGCL
jgi:hypothetical protein